MNIVKIIGKGWGDPVWSDF